MAAKKGSVEAFKQAEAERQERLKTKNKSGNKLPEKIQKSRDEFNAKVKKINESKVDQGSVARFKKAEEERKARVASFKSKQKPIDPVKRKEAISGTSDTAVKTAATVGAASASGDAMAKPKAVSTTDKGIAAASSFAEAFKKARAKGEGTKFAYNDKMYAAVTKDDVSRAGKTDLKDYLNSLSRKDNTQIAKAPGQKAMGGVMKKRGGGMASPFEREKMERMIRSAKAAGETLQRPGMPRERLKERMREKADAARDRNIRLKERMNPMKGERRVERARTRGQVSDMEMKFKSGGSVMARGCKLGRTKPTKMY